eukprot:15440524-Alexandrium_andersonii.AAC.1
MIARVLAGAGRLRVAAHSLTRRAVLVVAVVLLAVRRLVGAVVGHHLQGLGPLDRTHALVTAVAAAVAVLLG